MGMGRFFRRGEWDQNRLAEIESYVQIETDDNVARGMSYEDAYAAAKRKFGNVTAVREEIYRMNSVQLLETIMHDVKYALRVLRQHPMFTATAVLTLAIGIGANTAVFSVVDSVLLKPLRYPAPDELVALRQTAPGAAGLTSFVDGFRLSASMYFTYAEHNRTFRSLGVWTTGTANVTGISMPEQVRVVAITDGVLQTLGVPPVIGRWLLKNDQVPNGPKNVLLSYGYWQRRFGGARSVIGRVIKIDARSWQIVGVMPQGFRVVNADFDLVQPLAFPDKNLPLAGFGYQGVGRLKPGVSIAQANADMKRMLPIWMDSWSNGPGSDPHFYNIWRITPALRTLQREVVGNVGDLLWVVMATISLVMLIACANVTNLLLVKAEARQQELAVRAALGAGTRRILRGLLVESALLGMFGGVLGSALSYAGLQVLVAIGPAQLPRLEEISLDSRTVVFTLLLSILSSVVLALIPGLKYVRPQIAQTLRSAGRTASTSRERVQTRGVLVAGQVAIALVLLVCAGLMIRTFQALRTVDPGFTDAEHLQTMRISIPEKLVPDPERVTRMQNAIADKLAALPGVTSVGFGSEMPMEGFDSGWDIIFTEESAAKGETPPLRLFQSVSPDFFHAAGTRMIAGREMTWNDVYGQRPVALISENLARELWGTPSAAIGKRLRELPSMPWREVIGVVQDVPAKGVDEKPPATVYWPPLMKYLFADKNLNAIRDVTFVVRSSRTGTEAFVRQVQQAVWAVELDLPVASLRTMQEIYDRSLSRSSFTLVMLAIAGAMALILGIIGIYGVISYAVSQRRREIGIRLALGARSSKLQTMFVWSGLKLAGVGSVAGLLAAVGLTRFMKTLLFGISPLDPLTFAAVPLVLAVAVVAATYLPARRAASVDPVEVLKAE
jgi:predicted permease